MSDTAPRPRPAPGRTPRAPGDGVGQGGLVEPERLDRPPAQAAGAPDRCARLALARRRRRAWSASSYRKEAFDKDAADVAAAGLYPVTEAPPATPLSLRPRDRHHLPTLATSQARRLKGEGTEAPAHADSARLSGLLPRRTSTTSPAAGSPGRAPAAMRPRSRRCSPGPPGRCAAGPSPAGPGLARTRPARPDPRRPRLRLGRVPGRPEGQLPARRRVWPRLVAPYLAEAQPGSGARGGPGLGRAPALRRRQPRRAQLHLPVPRTAAEGAPSGGAPRSARVLKPGGPAGLADSVQASGRRQTSPACWTASPAFFHEPFYEQPPGDRPRHLFAGARASSGKAPTRRLPDQSGAVTGSTSRGRLNELQSEPSRSAGP